MQSVGVFVYGFVSERFARLQVTDMFGQYVPPELVEQMSESPDNALSFDGDRREMTVLLPIYETSPVFPKVWSLRSSKTC